MLWAAVSKLANLTGFLGAIYAYDLPLPRGFLKLIAVILPWVELLCGLSLVSRVWTDSALAMTSRARFRKKAKAGLSRNWTKPPCSSVKPKILRLKQPHEIFSPRAQA